MPTQRERNEGKDHFDLYNDEQLDPNGPNTSGCDASTNNSSSCDHTAIATRPAEPESSAAKGSSGDPGVGGTGYRSSDTGQQTRPGGCG
jgi:hypothetical protein